MSAATKIVPVVVHETAKERTEHAFGVSDYTKTYGHRELGARVNVWTVTVEDRESECDQCGNVMAHRLWDGSTGQIMPAGTWYVMSNIQTRAGENYGAGQPVRVFATVQERDAAVAKYLKAAKARCVKKFGGAK